MTGMGGDTNLSHLESAHQQRENLPPPSISSVRNVCSAGCAAVSSSRPLVLRSLDPAGEAVLDLNRLRGVAYP
jgi:hypothetical protein